MAIGSTTLYPTQQVAEAVTAYSARNSTPLPKHITDYHAWVIQNQPRFNYMISNFQAQCHIFLAHLIGAKRVLEIGVYVGYSSMVWSHAVGDDGKVTGLEFSSEYAAGARQAFEKCGVKNVEVIEGDALQTLPTLAHDVPFDLIFIDAQKSGYPDYLRAILKSSRPGTGSRLLRQGGLIVADNVLRRGLVADDSDENPWKEIVARQRSEYETDDDLKYLREFNELMHSSERLEEFLLPVFDGFGMAILLD